MLYLASRSPRRREILSQLGIQHEVLVAPLDEQHIDDEPQLEHESAHEYVLRTACYKAQQGYDYVLAQQLPEHPVLAADTTVIFKGQVLGKPRDASDAFRILRLLSGQIHEVRTVLALIHKGQHRHAISSSLVHFKTLTDAEIHTYCATGEPYDKAGAYGIQGRAGMFIKHLEGSYSGVMGMPVYELGELLNQPI